MLASDTSVLNVIDLLESGKPSYKLITTIKGLTVDSKFQVADSNNFPINIYPPA